MPEGLISAISAGLMSRLPIRVFARLRPPAPELRPERLYAYLDALWRRRDLDGSIVEIGCFRGGTTRFAVSLLQRTHSQKLYVCIDTFTGFVDKQFDDDTRHGTEPRLRSGFRRNSVILFEKLMAYYGCTVKVIQGDIATISDALLPDEVSVSLIDLDLEIPVYEALRRMYPRLVKGGILLVDDCDEAEGYPGAKAGYRRFVSDYGLDERYFMGMGIVEVGAPTPLLVGNPYPRDERRAVHGR
jgi:O-methyltransferase